jgi:hypothetical protein
MKTMPFYGKGFENPYDLDHEISEQTKALENQINSLNIGGKEFNRLKILLAMQDLLNREIQKTL